MLKLKLQYFGEELTQWKRPWCWERLRADGEEGVRGWDGWMASPMQWAWTWANSRRWWGTGKLGVLQSMGSERVLNDWVTEQHQQFCKKKLWVERVGWWAMEPGCPDMLSLQALKILGEGLSFRQCQCLSLGTGTWNVDEDWERSWLARWMLVNWSRAGWGGLFIDSFRFWELITASPLHTNEFHLRVRS